MFNILECTLTKAVELLSHLMDSDTQIEVFRDGKCTGIKTLADLKAHSEIYDCMSDDFGFIDRVEVFNSAIAVFIHSY